MDKKKLSKSEILKQKYNFSRNKKSQEELDLAKLALNNKSDKPAKEYAYDSDTSKKKSYG